MELAKIGQDDFAVSEVTLNLELEHLKKYLNKGGLFGLGEAYIKGLWQTDHLDLLMHHLITNRQDLLHSRWVGIDNLPLLLTNLFTNAQRGKKIYEIAERHYDLGNFLFQNMLDSTMSYTCGYWNNASSLESAQINKLDILCKKLGLKSGMKVLDIGCGWGNFAKYAAQNYGVSVVGLTVSREQANFAIDNTKGLPVEILVKDYQDYSGVFDRVVSIEMIEAVGRRTIKNFFKVANRNLKEDGLFALQVISAESFSKYSKIFLDQYMFWLLKYIFPNGYLPKLSELLEPARDYLILENIENISLDYEKTLLSWHRNFEQNWPTLATHYDLNFKRMWEYYLLGCAAFFRARYGQLYQIIYRKAS